MKKQEFLDNLETAMFLSYSYGKNKVPFSPRYKNSPERVLSKNLDDFAAQSVREYKEKLKDAVLSEINSNTSSHLLSRSTINHLIESTH